jgi:hypothetical protein
MANTLAGGIIEPDGPTPANAARIVPVRVAELLSWEPFVSDPTRVEELHNMRISAKRLRYTMELFAPFYGPDFKAAISQIKKIQEQLGNIHDADVMVPALADHLRRLLAKEIRHDHGALAMGVHSIDIDGAQGLLTLCRMRREERDANYRLFLSTWSAMRSDGFFDRLWVMVNAVNPTNAVSGGAPAKGPRAESGRNGTGAQGEETHDRSENGGRRKGRSGGRKPADSGEERALQPPDGPGLELVRSRWRGVRHRSHRSNTWAGSDTGESPEEGGA